MARQYSLPSEATGKPNRGDPRGMAGYIRETARKYGIDPEVALRVARSEGLTTFQSSVVKGGKREPSWGAFQLYTGGGLGNEFQKATGLDPSDPKNEQATIDYALKHAAKHGWGSWYGAKNTGIGEYEGIGTGAQAASETKQPAQPAGTEPVGGGTIPPDTQVKGTDTSTVAPDVMPNASAAGPGAAPGDLISRLQDPKGGASEGLGEAIRGLGQAVAGTGLNKDPYAAMPARPVPVAPPAAPPQVVPMVNPQVVNNQRQQLALAMQRLNSGRLV